MLYDRTLSSARLGFDRLTSDLESSSDLVPADCRCKCRGTIPTMIPTVLYFLLVRVKHCYCASSSTCWTGVWLNRYKLQLPGSSWTGDSDGLATLLKKKKRKRAAECILVINIASVLDRCTWLTSFFNLSISGVIFHWFSCIYNWSIYLYIWSVDAILLSFNC